MSTAKDVLSNPSRGVRAAAAKLEIEVHHESHVHLFPLAEAVKKREFLLARVGEKRMDEFVANEPAEGLSPA